MTRETNEPRQRPPAAGAGDADAGSWVATVPWVCLHLAVALVPLAISDFTWLGFDRPFTFDAYDTPKVFVLQALSLLSAAAWIWRGLTGGTLLRRSWVFWILLAFLGWTALATVLSINVPTALVGKTRRLEGLITFACYAWLFFLAVQEVRTPERLRSLARTLVLAGSVVSFYGLVQYLGYDVVSREGLPFGTDRSFSTLGNPNLLGGYLVFPLALAPALAWTERRVAWKIAYWVTFVLVAGVWVTTFTRGAWLGGVAALAVLALFAVVLRLRPAALDAGFVLVGAGAALAIGLRSLGSSSEVTNVASRLRSILAFGEGSAVTRFEIWQAALAAIRERPITGYGPDTFRLVFPHFKPASYVRDAGRMSVADNSHNYVLQSTVTLGIPGMLLLYGLFGAVLWIAVPSLIRRDEPQAAFVRVGFCAACVGYLVHLLFGISVSGSSTLLWIALGVLVAPAAVETVKAAPQWGRGVRYVVVGLAGLGLAAGLSLLAADHYYLEYRANPGTDKAVAAAETAVRLNPFAVAYRTAVGQAHMDLMTYWLRTAGATQQQGGDATQALTHAQGEYEAAVDGYQRARDFAPWEFDHYPNLADVYTAAKGYDPEASQKALAAAEQGLEVSPNDPYLRVVAANELHALERLDEAIALASEAVSLDPTFVEARATLGDLYRANGDLAAARQAYEAALATDPGGWLSGWLQQAIASVEASMTAQ